MVGFSSEIKESLINLLGKDRAIFEHSLLEHYGHDFTRDNFFMPEAIVFPNNTEEVSQILKLNESFSNEKKKKMPNQQMN